MCSGATIVERYRSRSGSLRACVQGGLENAGCERRFGERFEGGSVPRVFGGNPRHRGVTEACGFPALEDMETMTLSREDGQARYVREELVLRVARMADIPALTELIAASVRGLLFEGTDRRGDRDRLRYRSYDDRRRHVLCRRSGLGHRGVRWLESPPDCLWERRQPGEGRFTARSSDGRSENPWLLCSSRLGEARYRQEAAGRAGFTRFELVSTLTGVPLYRRHGYIEVERITIILGNNEPYEAVRMRKSDAR
jgi:hypothetical protein